MPTITSSESFPSPIDWFVTEMGDSLRLGERPVDQRRRRVLYLIVKWATAQGLPLDPEAILDPAMVERFCEVALSNRNSRATLRSDLRYMAPLLTRSGSLGTASSGDVQASAGSSLQRFRARGSRTRRLGPTDTYQTARSARPARARARCGP